MVHCCMLTLSSKPEFTSQPTIQDLQQQEILVKPSNLP